MFRIRLTTLLLVFACSLRVVAEPAPPACLSKPVHLPPRYRSFRTTIVLIQQASGCSIMAELADPLPRDPDMAEYYPNASASLDDLIRHSSGYKWQSYNGVVFIYNLRLRASPWNIGSVRLRSFAMPDYVGELTRYLPIAIQSQAAGAAEGPGGLIIGLEPRRGRDTKILSRKYENVQVRDILSEALKQVPGISFFEMPNDHPTKHQMLNDSFVNWILVAGDAMKTYKISEPAVPRRFIDKKDLLQQQTRHR